MPPTPCSISKRAAFARDLPFLANAYHHLGASFAPPGLCTMAVDRHLAADDAVISAFVL